MVDITHILGGDWQPQQKYVDPPELQLADAMAKSGITPPTNIKIDGQLHRFSTKGRSKDDSGWYIAFGDGIPAGRFGCWRDNIESSWRADIGRDLTASESMALARRQAEAQAARDQAKKVKHEAAASTVAQIWEDAGPASPDHPYLKRKQVTPHGARITGDGRLIVPMYGTDGHLSSLQYITGDGDKKYHPGGAVRSCFWLIGDPDRTIFIAEGFATAATIQEVTGCAVAIAYSASNIPHVSEVMREKYGFTMELVIVSDNDLSGVGKNYSDQGAAKSGARVVMPPEQGDANDYQLAGNDLNALLFPPVTDWLVHADEFSAQPAPLSWRVKHWVQDHALIMVHGPSGGGKTFVVLDWCFHISGNKDDWFGNKVRGGRVAYLAGEGHHGLKGRVAAWKQHHNVKTLDMYISRAGCDLNTGEGYQRAADAIRALDAPPAIVVIDTLHRFLYGDENSAQDAKTMLDACAALMEEFNCTVILVHHTGVSDEAQHRARGSSAWKGALDIEVSIVPSKNDGPMEIIQRKSKDAELSDPLYVELETVNINGWLDEDGDPVTSAVIIQGAEPIKTKANGPLEKHRKMFERAWFDAGADEYMGAPYLTKSALVAFLERQEYADRTIKNMVNPSYDKNTIGMLLASESIKPHQNGWIVSDQTWANLLVLMSDKG